MAAPDITSLPPSPSRSDLPATFSTKADAFVAALPVFRDELVTAIDWQNTTFTATETAKNAAQTAETGAVSAKNTAIAARDKAEDWAEAAPSVEVETGKYSALHWSDQAQTYSSAAQAAAGLPAYTGNGGYPLTVNPDESGVSYRGTYRLELASTTSTLDINLNQVFTVDASVNRTLSFINEPNASSTTTVVIKFTGNAGAITWPVNVGWADTFAPELRSDWTTITLLWDGSGWIGFLSGGRDV